MFRHCWARLTSGSCRHGSDQQASPAATAAATDPMPLNGIDHVELWVGQRQAGGVLLPARVRLPGDRLRGARDGRARPRVLRARAGAHPAGASPARCTRTPPSPPTSAKHGDGVQGIALSVPGRRRTPTAHATELRRARRRRAPRRRRACGSRSIETYGETLHTFVDRVEVRRRLPAGLRAPRTARSRTNERLLAIDHIVGNVELGAMEEWVQLLRARLRDDGDDPLLRRGDLDRVLGADVEGRHRRQGPREVPDQRAGRGQAQVADRRVPRLLRGRRRAAHRGRHARHRRHRARR